MTRPGAVELFVDRRDCPVKVGRIKLHSVKERLVGSLAERGKVGRVLLNAVYKTGIGCIGIFLYSARHRRQDLFGKNAAFALRAISYCSDNASIAADTSQPQDWHCLASSSICGVRSRTRFRQSHSASPRLCFAGSGMASPKMTVAVASPPRSEQERTVATHYLNSY